VTLIVLAIAWLLGILAADLLHLPLLPLVAGAGISAIIAALSGRAPRLRLAARAWTRRKSLRPRAACGS
jgi:H+/Cl- antiporter ClcA